MRNLLIVILFFLSIKLLLAQTIGLPKIYYGAAYYPEAWDSSQIDSDIRYMKELNMNVMRIGEFAWSTMEPGEGNYNFKWLHRVIEKLKANEIDVILGTPTATPPAWMLEKYPSMLATSSSGEKKRHGGRRDCSYSSKLYRQKSVEICERMAKEFGNKPGVIGWQTDNEFGLSFDYSPETELLWHQWLQKEYGSIDNLNKAWATRLWSQTYSSFGQIHMPRYTKKDGGEDQVWHHPSLYFAWKKFTNLQIEEFEKLQEAALRKHSKLPVTHDSMPGQPVDYETVMSTCDFAAVNCYHGYRAYDIVPSNYDRMRGMKKGFHWLFETAPGFSGGDRTWYNHEPAGSERAFVWLNYALGGQGTMFWLWQQHRAGQEMVHGAILSVWGKPLANYFRLKQIGEELKKTSDFQIQNPVSQAKVAIVYSHQAHYGLEVEPYVGELKYYGDWSKRFYVPLWQSHLHRDVIYQSADLSPYKMVIVPMAPILIPAFRAKLKKFVENGGIAVVGPMSGYRNVDWSAFTKHATGDLEDWMGIEVLERNPISSIPADPLIPVNLTISEYSGKDAVCGLWTESLSSPSGKVLAIYEDGLLKGKPAIVQNKVGKGSVVYFGTEPGKEATQFLYSSLAKSQGIEAEAHGGEGVMVVPRGNKACILVNLTNETKTVTIAGLANGENLITSKKIASDSFTLEPYEVVVARKP
jgi:beta-galactosidase